MDLDQAKQTFLEESRELLQQMETLLLAAEAGDVDADAINALFRCAHTIKGSAGLFGYDPIVRFTHAVESVLDAVRDGALALAPELVALLLECRDHMEALLAEVAEAGGDVAPERAAAGDALKARLDAARGQPAPAAAAPKAAPAVEAEPALESFGGGAVDSDAWHLSLRFGPDTFRNGMDPASFIAYLGEIGDLVHVETLLDRLPGAADMDPESCYLGVEADLRTGADKAAIEAVFDFVRDDCAVRILPPRSKLEDYVRLIRELPEDPMRLGEILVRGGALTARELEIALAKQAEAGAAHAPLGEILVEDKFAPEQAVSAALDKQKKAEDRRLQETKFVRVPAERLDSLINLVGELVIAGASAELLAARSRDAALLESASEVARLVEEIRDSALRLRMVPIGDTFGRFPRVVRDVAKELGKDIDLQISGGETELDKSMVEHVADPLMHLVRNAVDHGIESTELRLARGKPAKGTVRLNAFHDSGSIVIEVSDDGGGLDAARIRAKAVERGLIAPDQNLAEADLYKLILEPGFSTAAQVTNLSGRGVGMDVVKRNVEAMRGSIEIESRPGAGTRLRLRLPLTLAIIDGFLVQVDDAKYVLPLDMVVECVELGAADKAAARGRNYVNLRGNVLPFLRLREVFELPGELPARENIVVVKYGDKRAGLVVDHLLGEFQTVIKPLSRLFARIRGVGGSTILGSGEVALILDVPGLVNHAVSAETETLAACVTQV